MNSEFNESDDNLLVRNQLKNLNREKFASDKPSDYSLLYKNKTECANCIPLINSNNTVNAIQSNNIEALLENFCLRMLAGSA